MIREDLVAARMARVARAADVLRLLGRLEFATPRWVRRLVFPDSTHRMAAWRALNDLHAQGLVWRTALHPAKIPGAARRNRPPLDATHHVYGLTADGRAWLAAAGVEAAPATLDTFVVRDHRAPEVRPAQLAHDLLVVDWCVSAIDAARRCPQVTGIRCQLEYVSATDARGQAYQRFDALLCITLDLAAPAAQTRPGWVIPWDDQVVADTAGVRVLRMACELDRGTETLATLLAKSAVYAQLTRSGHYDATLGGPVLPVVVAPDRRRSTQIAREWAQGWPGGRGLVSTFRSAQEGAAGTLLGAYYTMTDVPPQRTTPLATIGYDAATWIALTAAWQPGAPPSPPTSGEQL